MSQLTHPVWLFNSFFLLGLLCSETLFPEKVQAQVSADGTLSTTVTSADQRNFVIDNGNRAGGNLFHSFREFSVPTGGSAYFNNAADVQNIFSRVTGGNVSNIDGLIRANGGANLFLLNPNGILVGSNARLNIGGSFVSSTADSILFDNGPAFSAVNPQVPPLLTITAPIGLQFGSNPGSITVQGSGQNAQLRATTSVSGLPSAASGLQVQPGRTLALLGGSLTVNGGLLFAPGGHIELGSVTGGTANITSSPQGFSLSYLNASMFGNIQMTQRALASVGGVNAGSIQIQGQRVSIENGSIVLVQNQGSQASGDIRVTATESFQLNGTSENLRSFSSLVNETVAAGTGGNITIATPRLTLNNGAVVLNRTFSNAPGGNITVNASSIGVSNSAPITPFPSASTIFATAHANGVGGNLFITTQDLAITDSGAIGTRNYGQGNSGDVTVQADTIRVVSPTPPPNGVLGPVTLPSLLTSSTFGTGNSGNLRVNTHTLSIQNGGIVSASSLSRGNAGNLAINASELIEINGQASEQDPSYIGALARVLSGSGFDADSGNITINTPILSINDGATIFVANQGNGDAGNLRINADVLQLDQGGSISASTRVGEGGGINLQTNTLTLRRGSEITATAGSMGNGGQIAIASDTLNLGGNSHISTQAQGAGNAGILNLRVGELTLNRGQIQVESEGTGNAGQLTIHANSVQLNNRSLINASTQVGQGGDVELQVRDTLHLNDHSQILANAQQSGRGGNVDITATETALRDRSYISTNAQGRATGGELSIDGDRLFLSNGSQITASTAGSGRAGGLTIHANDGITLSGNITRLAAASTTDAPAGSILLQTPDLQVSDRASISVSGAGRGGAGNLSVQANRIRLDNQAVLEAEVAGGDQGNITLNANTLLLRNHSTITTNATGRASGGNINLNSTFLIGLKNSDIVARAQAGAGGNINITATSVLGIAPSVTLTPDSDINASSQLGLNGSVSISNPDVKPDSGLVELPEEVTDSSQQVAQTCADTQASQFVATGRGGIPENPTQALGGDRTWNDLRDLSSFTHADSEAVLPTADPTNLVEASTARLNAQGQVELVAIAAGVPTPRTETCTAHP